MKMKVTEGFVEFQCPACGVRHKLAANRPAPDLAMQYTGTPDEPTLWPSYMWAGKNAAGKDTYCHAFVIAGHIDFLTDCTHDMARKIKVPLPEISE